VKDDTKIRKTDLTLHFCHVQSRNPPPTLCFSCHPPAGKSLAEMEGKTGITYLKNIYVFKPSSSIKNISFDCSYVVAHSGHLWHVCPNVDIIMSFIFLAYFISNSTADIQNGYYIEVTCNALK
jgi:hypothetical protein